MKQKKKKPNLDNRLKGNQGKQTIGHREYNQFQRREKTRDEF